MANLLRASPSQRAVGRHCSFDLEIISTQVEAWFVSRTDAILPYLYLPYLIIPT